jgi:transcriptional regulator NrdR family protein
MKCPCGGSSKVSSTVQLPDGVLRRRRCEACDKSFATLESIASTPGAGAHNQIANKDKPRKPKPDTKGLYTKPAAAEIRKQKVELRRKAEDRRNRVPSYFIEEDDY